MQLCLAAVLDVLEGVTIGCEVQLPDSPGAFKYCCIKFPGRSLCEVTLGYLHYS